MSISEEIALAVFGSGLVLVELYYWLVYVPRAWRTPGTNQEIDDVKYVWEKLRDR